MEIIFAAVFVAAFSPTFFSSIMIDDGDENKSEATTIVQAASKQAATSKKQYGSNEGGRHRPSKAATMPAS